MIESYFTDTSAFRLVHRERFVAFGGPRAVLLQGAHPLVMAGLAAHSRHLDDFRARLVQTVRIMEVIGFGPKERADRLTDKVRHMHARVTGELPADTPPFRKGTPYHALSPDLQLWVLFTMADSAMVAHATFVRPLLPDEQEALWKDWRTIGGLFGLREEDMPATLDELDEYRREMFRGETLYVTEEARRWIRRAVLEFPVPAALRPVRAALNFVTVSLLPDHVRKGYQLDGMPGFVRARLMGSVGATVRLVRPLLPEGIRITPEARGRLREFAEPE